MKRKILLTIFSLMLLSTGVLFALLACSNKNEAVPQDFTFQNRVITWGEVESAKGYVVMLDGKEYETEKNSFDTLPYIKDGGEYFVEVKAVFDGSENGAFAKYRFDVAEPLKSGYDEKGFSYTLLEDKSGYEISKGTADLSGALVIPDYFDGLPVTKIADYAFSSRDVRKRPNPITGAYCNDSVSIVMLNTNLESVGRYALSGFTGVSLLVIPDSVIEIGAYAFYGCSHLENVSLPKNLKVIPEGCFSDCALKYVEFPGSLEEIGAGAFKCNSVTDGESATVYRTEQNLTKVVIPDNVMVVGDEAFLGCAYLADIEVNGKFNYFGYDVFKKTAWYDSKPDGMIVIGELVYNYKGVFEEKSLTIPDYVSCIAARAFFTCKIQTVELPKGVVICNEAFRSTELKKLIIPDGVTELLPYVFKACYHLHTVVLPKSLKKLSAQTFLTSGNFTVYYEGNLSEWQSLFENDDQAKLFEELYGGAIYYYSDSNPLVEGKYWHYVDGEPTVW